MFVSVPEWTFQTGGQLDFLFIRQPLPDLTLAHDVPGGLGPVPVLAAGEAGTECALPVLGLLLLVHLAVHFAVHLAVHHAGRVGGEGGASHHVGLGLVLGELGLGDLVLCLPFAMD